MKREEAKANLIALGVADPTEEQISNYLNQLEGETNGLKTQLSNAQKDADEIRQGAIEYTDGLLANTEGALISTLESTRKTFSAFVQACDKSLRQVRANRAELSGDTAEGDQAEEE